VRADDLSGEAILGWNPGDGRRNRTGAGQRCKRGNPHGACHEPSAMSFNHHRRLVPAERLA
jgi:hypothetical protein